MERFSKKLLKNKQWYNQRFDGSPLFLYYMGLADIKSDSRKPHNTDGKIGICFFSHGKADWYFDLNEIKQGTGAMIELAKKDKEISTKLLRRWREDEKKFENYFWRKFPKIRLKTISNNELFELLEKLFKLFTEATSSTSIIDRFALGTDEIIASLIRKEVFSERSNFRESEFVNVFITLTAPVHQSFINQAEIDLLKIILDISKETLEQYQKRYFWVKNNYVTAQVLSREYFQKEIRAWEKGGGNLKLKLEKIEQTPRVNKLKKKNLLKKVKLSPFLKTLIKISEDFTWWQDQRKKFTCYNIRMGYQILQEISRRTNYQSEELKYTLLPEIKSIIKKRVPSREVLRSRIKNCVFILTKSKSLIFAGQEAKKIRKVMFEGESKKMINDFRGLTASSGIVTGRVKVVRSVQEMGKVQKGDILAAVMTRPDYIPAMKKASAIVTNEGGVTCHAAIVSRELGIPCVIGTKIATEALKDGYMVEVNANHGVVTILNR